MRWQPSRLAWRGDGWRSTLPDAIIEDDFGVVEALALLGVSDRAVGPSLPQRAGAGQCGAYYFVFFGF
eukprot:282691-Prorocentrum_lima.AAC.1